MDLRSLLQDVLSEVSSKVISFQIELHLLITWVKGSGLFQDYRIFQDMRHGITLAAHRKESQSHGWGFGITYGFFIVFG